MPTTHLQKDETPSHNEGPGYETKPFENEAPNLELREKWRIDLLPLLSGPLSLGVGVHVGVPSMG